MPSSQLIQKRFFLSILFFSLIGNAIFAQKDKNKDKLTAPAAPEVIPKTPYSDVHRENLLNGLQIITLERPDEPSINCDLIIRGGAMFDLVGKTGLANLTVETLLAVNPQLTQELETLQAKMNWGVTSDTTWFHIESPSNTLPDVISIIARLLVTDAIRPDAFKNTQQAILDKLKTAQPSPAIKADESFFATLYGDHPYGRSLLGSSETIGSIKQGDVYDFYKRMYLANNMFAIVHGNLKHERIMSVFRGYFGGWIKGVPAPPNFRPPYRTTEVRIQKIEQQDLANIEIRGGVIGVSHTDPDFIVTSLLSLILEKRIKQLVPTATAQFSPRILAAPLYFSASVPADKAADLSRQITDLFSTLDKAEITETELAQAQTALLKEQGSHSVAENLREIAVFKLPETYPLTFENKVKAISTLDLQRVAKRLLEANALTVLVLGKVNGNFKSQS